MFTEVVDRDQSVVCDAMWAGPMDFGKTATRILPALSIRATMIPRYSFPAAQQAQISEHLPAHSRGLSIN